MPRHVHYSPAAIVPPVRVFAIVLVLAFVVEAAIMLALAPGREYSPRDITLAVVDASTLTVVLAPAVWFLVVRPLQSLLLQRGVLLARVLEAQEHERARIARDLHDEIGQQLTAVVLSLRAMQDGREKGSDSARAGQAREMAAQALDAVRRISRGLSPAVLTDFGLFAATDRLCEDIAGASGLHIVSESHAPERRLRPEVEIAAYRVVQEALCNAARHASAAEVRVDLHIDRGGLRIEVRDDGTGLRTEHTDGSLSTGFGIRSMRERISLLRGEFRVDSEAESGTTISAWIPDALPPS